MHLPPLRTVISASNVEPRPCGRSLPRQSSTTRSGRPRHPHARDRARTQSLANTDRALREATSLLPYTRGVRTERQAPNPPIAIASSPANHHAFRYAGRPPSRTVIHDDNGDLRCHPPKGFLGPLSFCRAHECLRGYDRCPSLTAGSTTGTAAISKPRAGFPGTPTTAMPSKPREIMLYTGRNREIASMGIYRQG